MAGPYTQVFGYSAFGDLFLVGPCPAYLFTERPEVVPLDIQPDAFEDDFLSSASVIRNLLRQSDYNALGQRLGDLSTGEIYIPTPYPVSGGSGDLDTYQKGDVWVHLDLYAQVIF